MTKDYLVLYFCTNATDIIKQQCSAVELWFGTAEETLKYVTKCTIQSFTLNRVSFLSSLNVNDIQEMCQKNAAAALAVGRIDLAKVRTEFLLFPSDKHKNYQLHFPGPLFFLSGKRYMSLCLAYID